jgi:hypothetical protein
MMLQDPLNPPVWEEGEAIFFHKIQFEMKKTIDYINWTKEMSFNPSENIP